MTDEFKLEATSAMPEEIKSTISDAPRGARVVANVPFSQIYQIPNENCRDEVDPAFVMNLAESIKRLGLQQPVVLRYAHPEDKSPCPYILVAGYTRCMAVEKVLCQDSIDALISEMSPMEAIFVNLEENLQRKDITILQQAKPLYRLFRMGMSKTEIAKRVGKSTSWVAVRFALLQLEPAIQKMAAKGFLTEEHIRQLAAVSDPEARLEMAREIRAKRDKGYTGTIAIKTPETSKDRIAKAKSARARSKKEIEALLNHLVDFGIPFGPHTRALAWAAGNISDFEFGQDIQKLCREQGVFYSPSAEGFPTGEDDLYVLLRKTGKVDEVID